MTDYIPLAATVIVALLCCLALVFYAKRLGIVPAKLSETENKPTESIEYRLLGISVWSVRRTLNEEALYQRMEQRFEERMSQALEKIVGEKR